MKLILSALREAIKAGLGDIKSVHVVPDPDMLPPGVQFPLIGLKDGDQSFSEGVDQTESEKGIVLIYIYVQILKDEASIMGDGGKKGLLDLMVELRTLLNFNELEGVIHFGYVPEVMASEITMAEENVFVQRKGCRYVYEIV